MNELKVIHFTINRHPDRVLTECMCHLLSTNTLLFALLLENAFFTHFFIILLNSKNTNRRTLYSWIGRPLRKKCFSPAMFCFECKMNGKMYYKKCCWKKNCTHKNKINNELCSNGKCSFMLVNTFSRGFSILYTLFRHF